MGGSTFNQGFVQRLGSICPRFLGGGGQKLCSFRVIPADCRVEFEFCLGDREFGKVYDLSFKLMFFFRDS